MRLTFTQRRWQRAREMVAAKYRNRLTIRDIMRGRYDNGQAVRLALIVVDIIDTATKAANAAHARKS